VESGEGELRLGWKCVGVGDGGRCENSRKSAQSSSATYSDRMSYVMWKTQVRVAIRIVGTLCCWLAASLGRLGFHRVLRPPWRTCFPGRSLWCYIGLNLRCKAGRSRRRPQLLEVPRFV